MSIRKFMWFCFYLQVAALIIMLMLVVMQKMIPDYLMGLFVVALFLCIGSSFFVRRLEGWVNKL